jgi:hypothetical protein
MVLSVSQRTRLPKPNVHATLSRSVIVKAIIVTKKPPHGCFYLESFSPAWIESSRRKAWRDRWK